MDTKDNPGAPVIPAGTQPNAFGGTSFNADGSTFKGQNQGQGTPSPVASPSQNATQSQNAPEGTTFADLAAKKGFATPDDLAKAYTNLESHNKKVEMTAADILKEISTVPTAPTPVTPTPVAQPVSPDDAAINIVKSIVQSETKPLQQQIELQNLFMKNPDAIQYAAGLAQAVKANPGISWEGAYKIAKFDSLEQNAQKTQQIQKQQTDQLRQSTLVGSPSPTERGGPDVRSIIKDRSVPFKEVDRLVREYLTATGN